MDKHQNSSISFLGALQLIFITLKLTGTISWSWWVVLLPGILFPAIVVILTIGFLIYYVIDEYIKNKSEKKIDKTQPKYFNKREYFFTGIVKFEQYSCGEEMWIEDVEDTNTRITALNIGDAFMVGDLVNVTIVESERNK